MAQKKGEIDIYSHILINYLICNYVYFIIENYEKILTRVNIMW